MNEFQEPLIRCSKQEVCLLAVNDRLQPCDLRFVFLFGSVIARLTVQTVSAARGGLNESDTPIPRCSVTIVNDGLYFAGNGEGAERLADGSLINARFDATLGLAFIYRVARRNHATLDSSLERGPT